MRVGRVLAFTTLLLSSFINAVAQPSTKSIQLKPIGESGWKYFYDVKRVKSAFSLQIPIEGLNDPEVNYHFNRFIKLQKTRILVYTPGIITFFIATVSLNEELLYNSVLLLYAAMPIDLTLCILSHGQMGKAIDLYNIAIAQRTSAVLQLDRVKNSNSSNPLLSVGICRRF